jgi:iron complex transport system ATP-binding protein
MAGEYVLELRDVSVRRGERTILGPITFAIKPGERWVVLGPNGAGKSTLLQILATRFFPTTGSVHLLDKEMGKVDLAELRTRIGICGALISEDIPGNEKVRDVVLTAAYAILGR